MWNGNPHSNSIPESKPLEFELESELGIHLHSKFYSIPIPLWLSQTYLQWCSILSSIPIPQWMEWNVESRFDTGCCLGLLFVRIVIVTIWCVALRAQTGLLQFVCCANCSLRESVLRTHLCFAQVMTSVVSNAHLIQTDAWMLWSKRRCRGLSIFLFGRVCIHLWLCG